MNPGGSTFQAGAVGPTQPPLQWVPSFFSEGKVAGDIVLTTPPTL